jgi:hypothetical protein
MNMLYLDMELNLCLLYLINVAVCGKNVLAHDGYAINMHTHITLFCVNGLLQILVF